MNEEGDAMLEIWETNSPVQIPSKLRRRRTSKASSSNSREV